MSEKIYGWLIRLYPVRFQQKYQAEALLVFRERMRDERGLVSRLRLWMDLAADFVPGLISAYRNTYAPAAAVPVAAREAGIPAFGTLEPRPLPPGSIAMGGIFAVGALALFVFVMSHAPGYQPFAKVGRLSAASGGNTTNPDAQGVAEKIEQEMRGGTPQQRCSFERFELHPGNIGYLKVNWFADPDACGAIADAIMGRLGETDAIIFDLRDARGGYPEMVRRMAGWLFDRPVPWYNPRARSAAEMVTPAHEQGSSLSGKPVYVLTSVRTFSGAEHFAYNLKALHRATIVGETTSGASHESLPAQGIDASLPKPVWEGRGVQPDVPVKEADALRVAEKLALDASHQN